MRVTEYIHAHLDHDLDLNRLADIACLSPHHWHRIYHAVHGETLAASVKRLRLHRAAGDLAHTRWPVAKVARRCGYEDVSSFTRIFKAAYGLTPARFRVAGQHAEFLQRRAAAAAAHPVRVEQLPALAAVGLEHRGSYMAIGRAFETLVGRHVSRGEVTPPLRMVGLYHDDPACTPVGSLRSTACLVVEPHHPLVDTPIRGGWYAVLTYRGPYATMHEAYRWLYGTWLVESGLVPADAPLVEEYLNDPRTTAPGDLLTEIRLPLDDRPLPDPR
nr:AraC family transcriptional regulator [Caldimonas mangrovi]